MDQLKYSLRSVETYAPWARHIYIVTNGQGKNYIRLLQNDFDNSSLGCKNSCKLSKMILPKFRRGLIQQTKRFQ